MTDRIVTYHQTNAANDQIKIEALDSGHYAIHTPVRTTFLQFHKGPVSESGVNGLTNEALIAVLIDRLVTFQTGPFAHAQNDVAIDSLHAALSALAFRTKERADRGVEGALEP